MLFHRSSYLQPYLSERHFKDDTTDLTQDALRSMRKLMVFYYDTISHMYGLYYRSMKDYTCITARNLRDNKFNIFTPNDAPNFVPRTTETAQPGLNFPFTRQSFKYALSGNEISHHKMHISNGYVQDQLVVRK